MEKKWFYVGINQCGRITASMTTCPEYATPKKVDAFKREMDLTGRTTELREFSKDEFMEAGTSPNTQQRCPEGRSSGRL